MRPFLLVGLVLMVTVALWRPWRHPDDVMVYRGEKIKLSKAYRDFDAYKNDTGNIHPSEVERVQRLVIAAPIEHTFDSRVDVFRAVGGIAFPGYGVGSGVGHLSDGTELLAATVEIPRARKDRYLVFRDRYGRFELIDDFVNTEAAYPFDVRDTDGAVVYLHDGKEMFRRPRR